MELLDTESNSGFSQVSMMSSKTPEDVKFTKRLHSWTMMRTLLNDKVSEEIGTKIVTDKPFDDKYRLLLPDEYITTKFAVDPNTYRRGEKMQERFGGKNSMDQRNILGGILYFLYGVPRLTLSSVTFNNGDSASVAQENALQMLDNAFKGEDDSHILSKSRGEDGHKEPIASPYSSSIQHGNNISASSRSDQYSSSNYWNARLGKNPHVKEQEESNYYFGGFGRSSKREQREDISSSQNRSSRREQSDDNNYEKYQPGKTLEAVSESRREERESRGREAAYSTRPLPAPPVSHQVYNSNPHNPHGGWSSRNDGNWSFARK